MSGKQTGFTFVELMVVMAIIALLLTVALPRYFTGVERAKESVLKQDLATMRDVIDKFYSDKGHYPQSLEILVNLRYLRAIPVDPVTDSQESWITSGLPDDASVVFDVHSGASGLASDGSAYESW